MKQDVQIVVNFKILNYPFPFKLLTERWEKTSMFLQVTAITIKGIAGQW